MLTLLRRLYLIFILLPIAICYAILVMIWTIIIHIYDISVIKIKRY